MLTHVLHGDDGLAHRAKQIAYVVREAKEVVSRIRKCLDNGAHIEPIGAEFRTNGHADEELIAMYGAVVAEGIREQIGVEKARLDRLEALLAEITA